MMNSPDAVITVIPAQLVRLGQSRKNSQPNAAASAKGSAHRASDFDEAWDEARRREDEMVHHTTGGA
jgi:hypothetical protein